MSKLHAFTLWVACWCTFQIAIYSTIVVYIQYCRVLTELPSKDNQSVVRDVFVLKYIYTNIYRNWIIRNMTFHIFSSLWRISNARNIRLYYLYRQYANLFIFQLYSAYPAHYVYRNILVVDSPQEGYLTCMHFARIVVKVFKSQLPNPSFIVPNFIRGNIFSR